MLRQNAYKTGDELKTKYTNKTGRLRRRKAKFINTEENANFRSFRKTSCRRLNLVLDLLLDLKIVPSNRLVLPIIKLLGIII